MAHTKSGGSTALGRDSVSKRLGVKIFGGQKIKKGQIIVRQKGSRFHAGINVGQGTDHTLFALCNGTVKFYSKKIKKFTGRLRKTSLIAVLK